MIYYPMKRKSPLPLYVQLADIIKQNIREEVLKEQDLIPSESQLMAEYKISRITVRNALLRLEHDGEIFKMHGRGSFVASKKNQLLITSSFLLSIKEMKEQGLDVFMSLLEFAKVYPSEKVKSSLKLSSGQMVAKIKGIIKVNDKNIGIRLLFLPLDLSEGLKNENLEKLSLLDYLNKKPQTRIIKMEVEVHAGIIGDADADLIGADTGNTVLIRKVIFKNEMNCPIMYGRTIYLSQNIVMKMSVDMDSPTSTLSIKEIPTGKIPGTTKVREGAKFYS